MLKKTAMRFEMIIQEKSKMIEAALILGSGEIGSSIQRLLHEAGIQTEFADPPKGIHPDPKSLHGYLYDVIHVCFPFQEVQTFLAGILKYMRDGVKLIIIHSTTAIGTCSFLASFFACPIVHSPLRGTHPNIYEGIKHFTNFVGYAKPEQESQVRSLINGYYRKLNLNWNFLNSALETEMGKIVNTTWYGLQIAFATQIAEICATKKIEFDQAYTAWMESDEIGKEYKKVNGRAICDEMIDRPVMVPGKIGGHCVMPNLKLLEQAVGIDALTLINWIRRMDEAGGKYQ